MIFIEKARAAFLESVAVKQKVVENHLENLETIAFTIASSIEKGGTLFLCGNGGSLADAQHLAAELLVRLHPHVNRSALPALCLAVDMSFVTACGNDYSFDEIFSRSLEGLGRKGDCLLGISTSGNSKNVIKALQKAKDMGVHALGFLGGSGGQMLSHCDHAFVVPSENTARIQESHITAGHVVMEYVEDYLMHKDFIRG